MPSRRSGAARTVLWGLLGVAVLAGGAWLARSVLRPSAEPVAAAVAPLTQTALHEVRGAQPAIPPAALRDAVPMVTGTHAAAPGTPAAAPRTEASATRAEAPVQTPAPFAATGTESAALGRAEKPTSPQTGVEKWAIAPPVPAAEKQAPVAGAEAASTSPSFDIVRLAPSGSAVIAGRAAPDAQVALLDNGHEIGRGRADESGQFVVIPDKPLPAGGQELALREDRPSGKSVKGDTPALVVVPDRHHGPAPDAGSAHVPAAPAEAPVAVLAPPDAAPRLLSVPSDASLPAGQVALRVVDYDAKGGIRFAGTARPGSLVRLYIDDRPVGEARADAAGRWGLAPAMPVGAGAHRLRADDVGAGGQVLTRAEVPFDRAAFAADALPAQAGLVVVQPRQTLWRIARQVYGHGTRFTTIYAANRDQIRDPDRIYPGQVLTLPKAAAAAPARP